MRSRKLVMALVTVGVVTVSVVAVVATGPGWFFSKAAHRPGSSLARPLPTTAQSSPHLDKVTAAPSRSRCAAVDHPFDPRTIKVHGLVGAWPVITPPRDRAGIPGVPPLTALGKRVFAWDRQQGIRPGDRHGNVLLNAHTWPDGSALGNRLLGALHRGDRIVVRGKHVVLCYRVAQRLEVPATHGLADYYATTGPPRLAIVVCSGRRLGPGQWQDRTIWFAAPLG